MKQTWARTPFFAVALASSLLAGAGIATAALEQPAVVIKDPVNFTPHIQPDAQFSRPAAFAVEQLGDTVYIGGRFNVVANAKRTVTYERHNLMAFDANTGDMRTFAPNLNGDVWAIEASADAIYIGGRFTTIDGVARPAIAKLDPVTGAVDPAFQPTITSGRVSEIKLVDGRLLIGGSFTKKLSALNPLTGKNTNYIDAVITGSLPLSTDKVEVFKFSVTPPPHVLLRSVTSPPSTD